MKYSIYFGLIIKSNGLPKFETKQFQRMMNIISLEGKIEGLKLVEKQINKDLMMILWKEQKKLTLLTGNLKPEILLKEMITLSRS